MAQRYRLGRSPRCSLVLAEESISLEHCILIDSENTLRIEDVSHNGTWILRKGVRRRLQRHVVETLKPEDILYFGFYEHPFPVQTLFEQIRKLRLPVGSQNVRCPVHGIIYLESRKCPLCPT